MCCCQLAAAVAHLLPVLNSSCLCFVAPKQGPDSGSKNGATILKLVAQLPNLWPQFGPMVYAFCLLQRVRCAATGCICHSCFLALGARMLFFSQYIYIYIHWLIVCMYIYLLYIYIYVRMFLWFKSFCCKLFLFIQCGCFSGFPPIVSDSFPSNLGCIPSKSDQLRAENHLKSTSFKVCFPLNLKPIDIPLISH